MKLKIFILRNEKHQLNQNSYMNIGIYVYIKQFLIIYVYDTLLS